MTSGCEWGWPRGEGPPDKPAGLLFSLIDLKQVGRVFPEGYSFIQPTM